MPKPKINQGPCSIHNCNKESTIFRTLTDNAFAKVLAVGTFRQFPYLQIDNQICNAHYMEIVENAWNNYRKNYQNNINLNNIIENNNLTNSLPQLSLADKMKKMTTILYNKQRKESATLILEPINFKKMLEESDSDLIGFFDEICKIIIPSNWALNLQQDAKKKVVVILYLIAGIRNMHANQFKLELGLYLAACGASCETINTLSNAGISVTNKTVYNNKKKIASQHSLNVENYFIKNKDSFCIYNIDDYHNIHEKRRPDDTNLSGAVHLATSMCKKIEQCAPVPVIFNNKSVHNPVNVDPSIICEQLINKYQGLFDISYTQRKAQWASAKLDENFNFDRIDQLTVHCYDDAIAERKEERKMKETILIGIKEQHLHSMQDYLEVLNMILKYNEKIGHLKGFIAPVVADWPGQLFIRRAITHLQNNNSKSNIPSEVISFVPLLGPLHVSLNSREQVIKIYYNFFENLFHSVFGKNKKLAKKPRPWRINLLLELAYSAWIKIRILIIEKFGSLCKFMEYQTLIDLLDNIIPAVLDIYAVLFRSGSFDEYLETIFRIWTFALRWKRKNYNKAPLAFLSDIFYWEKNDHPMKEAIKLFLVNFNDYWIENIHSRIRASTTCKDNADNIQKQAYLLDANKHSAFREMFINTKHYPYSPSELEFLTNKTCIFLLQQFQKVFEEYQKIPKPTTISPIKPKSKKAKKEDSNIIFKFITMDEVDERVLPAGYHTSHPPVFNGCDYCYKIFEQDSDGTILICGHGYHWNCYNQIEFKCKHCINYFKEGIWTNVNAFVKRLEAEDKDKLTKEDLEDEDEDENEENHQNITIEEDAENIKANEKEKIELDLQNAINSIKTW